MRNLQLELDDLTFAELIEIGRSMIPSIAPDWTDHNVHDPGIMLNELLAWVADAQVYSLARTPRRDERQAYARLMGIAPAGPAAATGLVWPDENAATDPLLPLPWAPGTFVDETTTFQSDLQDSPVFHPTERIDLATARLTGVWPEGADADFSAINRRGGSSWLPFVSAPNGKSVLRLQFSVGAGTSTTATSSDSAPIGDSNATRTLSLGVEVPRRTGPAATTENAQLDRTSQCRASPLRVRLIDRTGEHELSGVRDTTSMFTQTGVLLLPVDASISIDGDFELLIDCPTGEWLGVPRIARILPNVVPLVQREHLAWADVGLANGMPDQALALPRPGVQFGADIEPLRIRVSDGARWVEWTVVSSFDSSGPQDNHVAVDYGEAQIAFGNGVNGRIPAPGSAVQADYFVCDGARGDLPAGLTWRASTIASAFGRNHIRMSGGRDRLTDTDLQVSARDALRNARPIVSSDDLTAAALALKDLGVSRAFEPPPQAGTKRVIGHRRLVVMGRHNGTDAAENAEPPAWRAQIAARLTPRLPLGQRLEVIAPRYVPFGIRATLDALPRVSPDALMQVVQNELARRLAITARNGGSGWPFGRGVSATAVRGWLRKLPGVARVASLTLVSDAADPDGEAVSVPRIALPVYQSSRSDIRIRRFGEAGTS